jgi:hypothetical protein
VARDEHHKDARAESRQGEALLRVAAQHALELERHGRADGAPRQRAQPRDGQRVPLAPLGQPRDRVAPLLCEVNVHRVCFESRWTLTSKLRSFESRCWQGDR